MGKPGKRARQQAAKNVCDEPTRLPYELEHIVSLSIYWLVFLCGPFVLWFAVWNNPTYFVPLLVLYYSSVLIGQQHKKLERPSPWFTQNFFMLNRMRRFYDFKLVKSPEFEAQQKKLKEDTQQTFVVGLHPHGCLAQWRVMVDGVLYEEFQQLRPFRTLAASVLFHLPALRELCIYTGCVDANRDTAYKALEQGYSLVIAPGGEHEQMITTYQKEEVYIKNRKGFVRLALIHGATLVPGYNFGTVDLFKTSTFLFGFRQFLQKRFYVALPIFYGPWNLLAVPFRRPVRVVLGEMINVGAAPIPNPTDEQVNEVHAQYIKSLKHAFESHKEQFGCGNRELVIG